MQVQIVGIAWFTEQAFNTLRNKFDDKEIMADTYSNWLADATKLLLKLEKENTKAVKVYLDPEIFVKWCSENKMNMDSKARVRYANEGAFAAYKKEET